MRTKLAAPELERKRTFGMGPDVHRLTVGKTEDDAEMILSRLDREVSTHIVGASGGGKSKLMELLIRQDLHDPSVSAVVVCPHGTLPADTLEYAAQFPHLAERVILVDPVEMVRGTHVCGFTPIPSEAGVSVSTTTSQVTSACLKAFQCYEQTSMPRTSRWLNNAILPVVTKNLTILETLAMFDVHSGVNREVLLEGIQDEGLLADWRALSAAPLRERWTMVEGAANRLSAFARSELSLMLGQRQHALSLAECFEKGKIVLISLNGKGVIGEEHMRLLGVLLVNECYRVGMQRDRSTKLRPVRVYLDEFQRFTTRQVGMALEELRKFSVTFVLAHQHLEQLRKEDDYLFNSVLTNCKNKVVFGGGSSADMDVMALELMSGFIDLNETKYTTTATRVRHVEETRTVYGASEQEGKGETEAVANGTSESDTVAETASRTTGTTVTDTTSRQESRTEGESEGVQLTTGRSQGGSDSRNQGTGRSEGTQKTLTVGGGETWSDSKSSGASVSAQETAGESEREEREYLADPKRTMSKSAGQTQGTQSGSSHADGGSRTVSKAEGSSSTKSSHEGTGHTDTRSETTSVGSNEGRTRGRGETAGTAHAVGRQESETVSRGETHGTTTSKVVTAGTSTTKSRGFSVSVVPFLKPVEYREESSRTPYTLQEQLHRVAGMLKNLPVGTCVMKLGPKKPVKVEVTRVESVRLCPRVAAERVERFKKEIYRRHPAWYLTVEKARAIIENRQRKLFKRVLSPSDVTAPALADVTIDVKPVEVVEVEGGIRPKEEEPKGPFEV